MEVKQLQAWLMIVWVSPQIFSIFASYFNPMLFYSMLSHIISCNGSPFFASFWDCLVTLANRGIFGVRVPLFADVIPNIPGMTRKTSFAGIKYHIQLRAKPVLARKRQTLAPRYIMYYYFSFFYFVFLSLFSARENH